ncbi:Transmembrane protein [Mycobacterium simiae]
MGWEGQGGDALRARTGDDLAAVSAKADLLRNAAKVARTGASNISAAQRRALYAVEDAENEGFQVSEDLSVIDTHTSRTVAEQAARQAQAQAFAGDINQRAAQLLAVETDTSGQLTAAAGDVGGMNFPRAPGGAAGQAASGSPDDQIVNGPNPNGPHIRLVDEATGPGDPPNPTPGDTQHHKSAHFRYHLRSLRPRPRNRHVPLIRPAGYSHRRTCHRLRRHLTFRREASGAANRRGRWSGKRYPGRETPMQSIRPDKSNSGAAGWHDCNPDRSPRKCDRRRGPRRNRSNRTGCGGGR